MLPNISRIVTSTPWLSMSTTQFLWRRNRLHQTYDGGAMLMTSFVTSAYFTLILFNCHFPHYRSTSKSMTSRYSTQYLLVSALIFYTYLFYLRYQTPYSASHTTKPTRKHILTIIEVGQDESLLPLRQGVTGHPKILSYGRDWTVIVGEQDNG